MTGEYELLKKVLSTIEVKEGLNQDNIIEEIQEELKKQDQGLYQEWEKGEFDVNHGFSLNISGIEYSKLPLLIIAAQNGYTKTVKALKAGANVDAVDQCKRTPLHHAALNGRVDTVEVLIKKGANVNAVDKNGKTYLDYDKRDVKEALLEERGGSFVKARNKSMIAGGVTGLLGTAIAVALFTTGTIAAQLIPIVIAVVAVIAAALVVGCATYALLKPSTKVDGAEKPSAVLTTNEQRGAAI
ncbi:hypothetical protein BBB02_01790 [Wolbachia endosymbiont of Bemisia tabaci]|uniref:ankyrin repeat domain-containing protein n=1 Tax=Wolbachia endosymbiont of Bemisia tabaci TaxID=215173 RepID=UPI000FD160F0|nr:ankyrin repeat domain-containing protein [Wolbachia endosymbiont of Bemisia tabaci]AZU37327.1 hypothetical protein BBB02_01790 [Wolbachia endosymbiont of Bemisia tabaci]